MMLISLSSTQKSTKYLLSDPKHEAMAISDLDVRFFKNQMQHWKHKTFIAARAAHVAKANLLLCRDLYRRRELQDTYEHWIEAFLSRKKIYKRNLRQYIELDMNYTLSKGWAL